MTIAVGVIGPFGIVLAADSEEGAGSAGDLKSSAVKITGRHILGAADPPAHKSILISGAGDCGYLSLLKQHIVDDFESDEADSIESLDTKIRERVDSFYQRHVVPFSDFRNTDFVESLMVSLVIGASFNWQGSRGQRLWLTYMNGVKMVPNFEVAAVGSGEQWVTNIIPVASTMDAITASAAAAYGIFFAKDHASGCGKQIRMALMRHGKYVPAKQESIDRLEIKFGEYNQCERYMRNTLLGIPDGNAFSGIEERLPGTPLKVSDSRRS